MKKVWKQGLVVVALTCMTLGAKASPRLEGNLEQEVQDKLDKIQKMTERMERNLYTMNIRKLRNLDKKLDIAIEALKPGNVGDIGDDDDQVGRPGNGGGRPGGGYGGGYSRLITVSGSIENKTFMFDVVDAMDLASQCADANVGKIGNADEITVSVDFSPMKKHTTSGWWRGAGEVCAQLASKAVEQGLPSKLSYDYSVVGSIESATINFKASTLRELMLQCTDFYNSARLGNVDELTVFNGTSVVKKTTSGWWSNSNEVCNIVVQQAKM